MQIQESTSTGTQEVAFEGGKPIYYRFRLETEILWNIKLREDMARLIPLSGLVTNRSGEGMKFCHSGVIEIPQGTKVPTQLFIQGIEFIFSATVEEEFNFVKRASMNKVFFKGFPYQVTKSEVKSLFEKFGEVKYIYFMCEPKKTKHPCKMGYVVYDSRDSVDTLFSNGGSLRFDNYFITCEEYLNTKKSRREYTKKPAHTNQLQAKNPIKETIIPATNKLHLATGKMFINTSPKQNCYQIDQKILKPNSFLKGVKRDKLYWLDLSEKIEHNSLNLLNLRFNVNIPQGLIP